jgi:fluoride exporter
MEKRQLVAVRSAAPKRIREWREAAPTIAAIGVGGVIGALLRWRLGEWSAERWPVSFPWGTLLINISGSFILGLYVTFVSRRHTGGPYTRLLVATGILGAYTTFSTFVYETVRLLQHGEVATGITYLVASLAGGLAACAIGVRLGGHT